MSKLFGNSENRKLGQVKKKKTSDFVAYGAPALKLLAGLLVVTYFFSLFIYFGLLSDSGFS